MTGIQVTCYPEAKGKEEGKLTTSNKYIKVAGYYYKNADGGIYISQSKNNGGAFISLQKTSDMGYHGDAYFSGGYIYYSCYDKNSKKDVLYRMKPDGSQQERLVTLRQKSTGGNGITLVYGNSIYYIRKYHNHFYLYSCNLQGKKQKKLAEFKGDNALPAISSINQKYCKIVAYNYGKKHSKY